MQYALKGALEDNVLTVLAYSETHAAQFAMQLTAELFSTRPYQVIAEAALTHIAQFGKPPRTHLRDLLEEKLHGTEGQLLVRYIEEIDKLAPEIQPAYVAEELDKFIQTRRLSNALTTASDALHSGDIPGALDALRMRDLLHKPQGGIWLHDPEAMLQFLNPNEGDHFSSGIDTLDNRGIRPGRGELFLIIGSKGVGKSWWLIQIGKHNILQRRSVLHLTLELSQDFTAERYVQSLFAMTTNDVQTIRVPVFQKDTLGRCVSIDFDVRSPEILGVASRKRVAERLRAMRSRSRLMIKEFPARSLNTAGIDRYLDYLEQNENFRPDMLVLDQAFNLRFQDRDTRLSMGQEILNLRGLAQARNMAIATSWQGNRFTDRARVVTTGMIAEDWSLGGTADTICTISRTDAEYDSGLARILVDKARRARDKFLVLISQNYDTGQFALDSTYLNKFVQDEVDRLAGVEEEG